MEHSSEDRAALVAELENRIEELEGLEDAAFGNFTGLDWAVCVLGAVVLPYAVYVWFWR